MKDTVSQPAGGRGATAPRPADAASPSCGSSPSADSLSVVLAGGGTAGHVEPAMAVADALVALDPRVRITALGTLRGLETRLVPQRGYHLELITAVPMPRKPGGDLARLPSRVWRAARPQRWRPRPSTPPSPQPRHTASTSRLAATASGSATSVRPSSSPWCGRCARGGLPARARTTDGPAPSHNAMASNTAAALTTLADR